MKQNHEDKKSRLKMPLWKWLVFLLIALSMPLLFMTHRAHQTERAIEQSQQ